MRQIVHILRIQQGHNTDLTVYEDRRRASLALTRLASDLSRDSRYQLTYYHADDRFLTSVVAGIIDAGRVQRMVIATIESQEVQ